GRVAQSHRPDTLGDPARLVEVELLRLTGVDREDVATTGALVAPNQDRRLAILPALVDVGTARLLTHRVQLLALDQRAQRGVLGTHPGAGLDPRRLLLDRGLAVAYLQAQQLPSLGGHGTHANSLRWAASAPAQARG